MDFPKAGIAIPAWANATTLTEWVCAIPLISWYLRYNFKCVLVYPNHLEIVHDDTSEMRNGQNNFCESLVTQTLQLMLQNRLSFDFYRRLGRYHWKQRKSWCPCCLPLSLFSSHYSNFCKYLITVFLLLDCICFL